MDMCTGMRVSRSVCRPGEPGLVPVYRHVYGHVCRHVYRHVSCADTCADTCAGMCADMCTDPAMPGQGQEGEAAAAGERGAKADVAAAARRRHVGLAVAAERLGGRQAGIGIRVR